MAFGSNIYLTYEQWGENNASALTQQAIDNAFSKPPRLNKNKVKWKDYTITILRKKLLNFPAGSPKNDWAIDARHTNLERTLIDMVVAPEYGGGCINIVQAFAASKKTLDIKILPLPPKCRLLPGKGRVYPSGICAFPGPDY
jgi:hypothetical protein